MTDKQSLAKRITGLLIYLAGAALALALFVLIIWPDIESAFFDHNVQAQNQMSSLHCPVLMTRDETRAISVKINNPTDRDVNPNVRARITRGSASFAEQIQQKVSIPAGESRTVEFQVDKKNVAYDRMILGRFYQMANLSLPSSTGTCGIYVLPFSGPSGQVLAIGAFAAGLGLMAVGLIIWLPKDKQRFFRSGNDTIIQQRKKFKAFVYLGGLILGGILLALVGSWLVSGILAVVVATSIIGVISYTLISQ